MWVFGCVALRLEVGSIWKIEVDPRSAIQDSKEAATDTIQLAQGRLYWGFHEPGATLRINSTLEEPRLPLAEIRNEIKE